MGWHSIWHWLLLVLVVMGIVQGLNYFFAAKKK